MSLALARQAWRAMETPTMRTPRRAADAPSAHEETPARAKVRQAVTLLGDVGLNMRDHTPWRRDRMAMALLAVAGLKPEEPWSAARSYLEDRASPTLSQRGILHFWNAHYGTNLADSSYDDIKRKDLAPLEASHLVMAGARNPDAPDNDGTRGHAITLAALPLLRAYGGKDWPLALTAFREAVPNLAKAAAERRRRTLVPVKLPGGRALELTPGPHNTLQEVIVRQFLGGFAPDAHVLYIADAASKRGEYAELRAFKDEEAM